MEDLGMLMANNVMPGMQVHLSGPLGAGKTTLARGFLRGFDYPGKVKSPTFTLVEPYEFGSLSIYHFDLYRIDSPLELDAIGFREYPGSESICLIEWPEKAESYLEDPDLYIKIELVENGRQVQISAETGPGEETITRISSACHE
ncbi:MAG: tRNA (adenosine(37)-N6)-threonylcarbamoyltransferase complex ATPase subunit type 1 TsaE [Gammaproteobacteria bacterium]|nr:tRNA (adenosine(37)-N6)-threonylcarbamoyltransferase complex ATPase subunit type 1 TsaE [Gammaproteobacteria bacterium]